jgi:prolyl-tRNA synthetase
LVVRKGIEVGHIFNFGTKYSNAMKAFVNSPTGDLVPVQMGSYGIGVSRLVAAIIEANHDEKGIIWPESVAPFKVSLINLNSKDSECSAMANYIYNHLKNQKVDVLYDDTDERPGSKFATHDLIGSPWQVIVGPKKVAAGVVELKHRRTGEIEENTQETLIKRIVGNLNVR